jgi:hypothetical protein
VCFI